ncbi:hypothetical protein E4T56_gene3254 [Termitomyces sp. T112]|nr:hypothetical protein E4T56_gene3254 [Termitomyces sp. T112]
MTFITAFGYSITYVDIVQKANELQRSNVRTPAAALVRSFTVSWLVTCYMQSVMSGLDLTSNLIFLFGILRSLSDTEVAGGSLMFQYEFASHNLQLVSWVWNDLCSGMISRMTAVDILALCSFAHTIRYVNLLYQNDPLLSQSSLLGSSIACCPQTRPPKTRHDVLLICLLLSNPSFDPVRHYENNGGIVPKRVQPGSDLLYCR